MQKFIGLAIDAEFTSFDMVGGDMIDFGVTEVWLKDGVYIKGRKWQGYLKPSGEKYFTEGAREVHGISYFKALSFPEPKDTIISLLVFLKPLIEHFPMAVIYYGSWNFDLKWLQETCRKVDLLPSFWKAFKHDKDEHIHLMNIVKDKIRNMPKAPGETGQKGRWKLDNVARHYEIKFKHHTAGDDADTTAEIYCNIMNGIKTWTGELNFEESQKN